MEKNGKTLTMVSDNKKETVLVTVHENQAEKVLGQAMRKSLGFRTPTSACGTWANRLDSLENPEFHSVVTTIAKMGYGAVTTYQDVEKGGGLGC